MMEISRVCMRAGVSVSMFIAACGVMVSRAAAEPVKPLADNFETPGRDDIWAQSYRCLGSFISLDTIDNDGRLMKALRIAVPDSRRGTPPEACPDHPNNDPRGKGVRGELGEPRALQLPLGTEVWYAIQFRVPASIKSMIRDRRLVIMQIKHRKENCRGHVPFARSETEGDNPILSVRLKEDPVSGIVGIELAASSENVTKIPFGLAMRDPSDFFDRWHELKLQMKVVPRLEGKPPGAEYGFAMGWLDGHKLAKRPFGEEDGKGARYEAFGYPAYSNGCTALKFGVYRDADEGAGMWTVDFARYRRASTEKGLD